VNQTGERWRAESRRPTWAAGAGWDQEMKEKGSPEAVGCTIDAGQDGKTEIPGILPLPRVPKSKS
jgi:hypothetical protein